MAVLVLFSVLFMALAGAAYCVCKDGVSDAQLQKSIDYACGNGADCSAILQNGVCYNPNTVKDHCSYAVNSYYQKKASSGATCEFSGTATLTANLPYKGWGFFLQINVDLSLPFKSFCNDRSSKYSATIIHQLCACELA
nr:PLASMODESMATA CALLOSE-BINDING PROTEIN 3-like [Ipomoea batatas]